MLAHLILSRNWWSLVLRGLVAIAVAVVTFIWPGITLQAIVLLFGGYALIDGVLSIVGSFYASKADERWGALLLHGLVGIAAAIITFLWPAITAISLVWLIAAWAVVTGVFQVVAAIRLRRHITGEWLLALCGIASIAFGIFLAVAPLAGAIAIALWIGVYTFAFGCLLIALGFRLKAWTTGHAPTPVPSH